MGTLNPTNSLPVPAGNFFCARPTSTVPPVQHFAAVVATFWFGFGYVSVTLKMCTMLVLKLLPCFTLKIKHYKQYYKQFKPQFKRGPV